MSTAKSLAALHLNGKRRAGTLATGNRFKSSTSNLTAFSSSHSSTAATKSRLQSTSMTNLIAGDGDQTTGNTNFSAQTTSRIQRPASRNALDTIHNGMNAKYAQVQSKVYLQNIRPQQQQQQATSASGCSTQQQRTKIPSKDVGRRALGVGRLTPTVPNERSAQLIKLKELQDNLERAEEEREQLKQELDREKNDKAEQVQLMKQELQEKLAEHDKQNEEYHQKLLEAYELADQNRRATDSVLNESRQREEDSRKKIEELESQLNELKEFVAMKEEMTGKMYELREQIRDERQRYEEQLKSLHQVFENEKISHQERGTNLTGVNNNGKAHSSNYFNRIKPSLQSTESIDKQFRSNCSKCQSGSSQLHRSEQDIYGSKLSTRMHDTARSAWRASKQFASSVITGGVGLSACRQCTRRQSSSLAGGKESATRRKMQPAGYGQASGCRQVSLEGVGDDVQLAQPSGAQIELAIAGDDQHTSVIEVQSLQTNASNRQSVIGASGVEQQVEQANSRTALQTQLQHDQTAADQQQQQQASLIRIDENNKLTIVTKFNDSECNNNQSPSGASLDLAAPSSGSERSRCESSSSGRGTSSDAGSTTVSQNGDLDEGSPNAAGQVPVCHNPSLGSREKDPETPTAAAEASGKRHKRKLSLFKTNKVFGGSQVSLNKLKSFFAGSSGKVALADASAQQQSKDARQQGFDGQARDHLESSRLRCLELNQNIRGAPSIDCNSVPIAVAKVVQVGQGCDGEASQAESGASFSMMRDETQVDGGDTTERRFSAEPQQQMQGANGTVVLAVGS